MTDQSGLEKPLPLKHIFNAWWPLAFSWMLMGSELPALSAIIARLPDPKTHLAAYGGVVFPLALIIEAPIIMLLAASTTLSKDLSSYIKIRRYMVITSAVLTCVHILVVFTPLYYLLVEGLLNVQEEVVEPARIGLMIMIPWTWSIAYRRFNQGVLIRFGHSRSVGTGTIIRFSADILVLAAGYFVGNIPGIVVATSAVIAGVISEAIYVGIIVRPVIDRQLKTAPIVKPPLTLNAFTSFYIPLMMTSILTLLANPIGSAAINRMPRAFDSLAAWGVVAGLTFMIRALGIAYNEVVLALLDKPLSSEGLKRFAGLLAAGTSAVFLVVMVTPLADFLFLRVSALPTELATLAKNAMWFALPLPALNAMQSWYQGLILHEKQTRAITEAVIIYLLTSVIVLLAGVLWGQTDGLYVGMGALTISVLTQTLWLRYRSTGALRKIQLREMDLAPQA